VDPYNFVRYSLPDIVRLIIKEDGGSWRVFQRSCANGYEARYQTLLDAIVGGVDTVHDLIKAIPNDSLLSNWCDNVNFRTFCEPLSGRRQCHD
jgi:hypothetical protein